jgi:putative SOS response-associated peptidase YedK
MEEVKVILHFNNELDATKWRWAIVLDDETRDVWLNCFDTSKEALKFCRNNGFQIVEIKIGEVL